MKVNIIDRQGDYDITYHDKMILDHLNTILDLPSVEVYYKVVSNKKLEVEIKYDASQLVSPGVLKLPVDTFNNLLGYNIDECQRDYIRLTKYDDIVAPYNHFDVVVIKGNDSEVYMRLLDAYDTRNLEVYDYTSGESTTLKVLEKASLYEILRLADNITCRTKYTLTNGVEIKGTIIVLP